MKRLSLAILRDLEEIFQVKDLESPVMIHKKGGKMYISLSSWGHNGRVWTKQLFSYLEMKYGLWIDMIEPLEETVVLATFKHFPKTHLDGNHSRMEVVRQSSVNRVRELGMDKPPFFKGEGAKLAHG